MAADLSNYFLVDISDNKNLIAIFNKYIKIRSHFYSLKINKRIINIDGDACTIYDEPLLYNDTDLNAEGRIITNYIVTELNNGGVKINYEFKIWINNSFCGKKCYTELVADIVRKEARHGDRVQLNYYKILNEQLITHNFYNKNRSDWIIDSQQLRNEFFSPHKKYLFDVMQQKNRNGNWSNLILHGEPGTGKSSFVYRLATQLQMSIISVDLSMYIDRKRDLYSIFHGNEFNLPFGKGQKLTVSQNCIIILEEFDSSIEKIRQLENIFNFKNDTIHSYVNNKTSEIEQKVRSTNTEIPSGEDPYEVKFTAPLDYILAKRASTLPDIDPNKINNEIYDIVRTITDDHKSDVLRLRDLLELFQGPIPVQDRIIVATTNNFEQISHILPALFRPGRLTPIKFSYLDWESFKELCKYYFDVECLETPIKISIPTSHITEMAIKYISMAGLNSPATHYKHFINELIYLNNVALARVQTAQTPQSTQMAQSTQTPQSTQSTQSVQTPQTPQSTQSVQTAQTPIKSSKPVNNSEFKANVYSKWMDKTIGIMPDKNSEKNPKATNKILKPNTTAPTAKSNASTTKENDDEYLRQLVIEKSMTFDKQMQAAGHYQDSLLENYQKMAIMAPQFDEY